MIISLIKMGVDV